MTQDSRDPDDDAARDDGPVSVPDEDLPDDLQPTDDNPLAQPADDDVPDDILTQGVGHGDSGGSPEDASTSGIGEAVGDDDESAASSREASSGPESDD